MILDLIEKYIIDRNQSFMVGDWDVDIQADQAAGVRTIFIGEEVPVTIRPDYTFQAFMKLLLNSMQTGSYKISRSELLGRIETRSHIIERGAGPDE